MALWGNNDNVGAAGSVSVNYATKTVTGPAGTGSLGPLFGETGNVQAGDVISFGVKTKPGTYFGDAIVVSIASTTSLSIASTAGLSGAAIAATTFSVSQKPKFTTWDPAYSKRSTLDFDTYAVSAVESVEASGTQYESGVGWVGVQTYVDSGGNLRVKKEILCAMSGISTGNTPHYPNIELAN
tara:strand:- start:27 stop:575 length:549 start_codon:yes stop_codon:yes gene_type:complete